VAELVKPNKNNQKKQQCKKSAAFFYSILKFYL